MSNKQIQFKHFTDVSFLKLPIQDKAWVVKVKGEDVSVVKWNNEHYNGDYEMYSSEILFKDVERFSDMQSLLIRLTELENK